MEEKKHYTEQDFINSYKSMNNWHENTSRDIKSKIVEINDLAKKGWNKTSIKMTFPIFEALRNGDLYIISMPKLQTRIFLSSIQRDYGIEGLKTALNAVHKYLKYKEETTGRMPIGILNIYNEFSSLIGE